MDLGFIGPKFIWLGKRANGNVILECLGRSLCNLEWHELFPNATVAHLPRVHSDHAQILTNLFHTFSTSSSKPFGFETT